MSRAGHHALMILSDADVGAGVALQHAAESVASGGAHPASLWIVPARPSREVPLRRQAGLNNADLLAPVASGSAESDQLLSVGREAAAKGASRVIWPAHAGIAGDPEEIDLDRASAIAGTAMLVERLLEIEFAEAPAIDAPFADLCDRQLAELAIDVGLLPGEVWWGAKRDDEQLRAAERWAAAFEAAGMPLRTLSGSQPRAGRG